MDHRRLPQQIPRPRTMQHHARRIGGHRHDRRRRGDRSAAGPAPAHAGHRRGRLPQAVPRNLQARDQVHRLESRRRVLRQRRNLAPVRPDRRAGGREPAGIPSLAEGQARRARQQRLHVVFAAGAARRHEPRAAHARRRLHRHEARRVCLSSRCPRIRRLPCQAGRAARCSSSHRRRDQRGARRAWLCPMGGNRGTRKARRRSLHRLHGLRGIAHRESPRRSAHRLVRTICSATGQWSCPCPGKGPCRPIRKPRR